MPRYTVIADGFFEGKLYSPTGKRKELHTDEELKPHPEWLKPLKEETAAQKGARTKAENAAQKAAEEKAKADKAEIDAVTFAAPAAKTTATL